MTSTEEIIAAVADFLEPSSSSEDLLTSSTLSTSSSSSSLDLRDETEAARNCEFINKIRNFSNEEFRQHLRLTKASAIVVIEKYRRAEVAPKGVKGGRPIIGYESEIYIFLWYIANTVTFRQIANLFSIAKSAAWEIVRRVSSWLVSISSEHISWPTSTEAGMIARKFELMKGIPDIIGAIDGTHIKIKAPKENRVAYFNRRKYYSLAMQCIVDADKKFIDVHCGEPGSLHDSRILRRSNIFREAIENQDVVFSRETFILGDSAYASLDWLVPPFKDNGSLSDIQKKFNTLHSSTRIVVENAFGLLKGKFRRLQFFTESVDLTLCSNLIVSACVLHNICLENNEPELEENFRDENDTDDSEVHNETVDDEIIDRELDVLPPQSARDRRDRLIDHLIAKGIL